VSRAFDKLARKRDKIKQDRIEEATTSSYTQEAVDRINTTAYNVESAPLPGATLIRVNIDDIEPAPELWNFFHKQVEERIFNLAISFKNEGQLSPIIIREIADGTKKWQTLAGHTRCLAARYLRDEGYEEWQYIYAFAYPLGVCSDTQARRIIVYSNTEARTSLTEEEKIACFYFQYCDEANNDRNQNAKKILEKLMERFGIKRSQAYNYINIGKNLIDTFKEKLAQGIITVRNAIALAKMEPELQTWLYKNYQSQMDKDNINIIAKMKSKEEILDYFNSLKNDLPQASSYIKPKYFKKVDGGKLAKVFVMDGLEEEFQNILTKFYAKHGIKK